MSTSDDVVTWSRFVNPHRPGWDYAGLGPFVFSRQQYDAALADLTESIASLVERRREP